jgi:hypothetical protein
VSWVKSAPFHRDPDDTVLALETAQGGRDESEVAHRQT